MGQQCLAAELLGGLIRGIKYWGPGGWAARSLPAFCFGGRVGAVFASARPFGDWHFRLVVRRGRSCLGLRAWTTPASGVRGNAAAFPYSIAFRTGKWLAGQWSGFGRCLSNVFACGWTEGVTGLAAAAAADIGEDPAPPPAAGPGSEGSPDQADPSRGAALPPSFRTHPPTPIHTQPPLAPLMINS